jgi:hypothetical protein
MSFLFRSGEGTADNAKAIFHRLRFQHSVTVDYELGLTSNLGLSQEIRGPVQQISTQPLGITHEVYVQHGVPYPVAHNLGMSHSVVHAGAFGGGGLGALPFEATFDSNVEAGQPVYIVSGTNVDLADNTTNYWVIGLAFEPATAGNIGRYITEGTVEKTDWTNVTGTTLLTPGAVYYLDSTAGRLTSTPTTTDGEHVVAVARAASTTELDIEIAEPILL